MGEKITNLTAHDPILAVKQSGSENALVYDDYREGFRVARYGRIEGGIGIGGTFYWENAQGLQKELMGYVGIMPIVGSRSHTTQFAKTHEEIKKLPELTRPPEKAEDLEPWAIGDDITYVTEGGVLYYAGIRLSIVGNSVMHFAKGSWSVYVQKTGDQTVYVKLTKGKLSALSAATSVLITSLAVSDFSGDDKYFSYNVDISSDEGRRVYENLVKGNLTAVQDALEKGEVAQLVEVQTLKQKGKFFNAFIGVPILANKTFSKGNIETISRTDIKIDNSNVDVTYGVFVKDRRNRFFGTHSEKTTVFYGAQYLVTNGSEKRVGYFGRLSLTLTDDSTRKGDLRSMVRDIKKKGGFKDSMDVVIPKNLKMDYAGTILDVTFSQENTDRMIEIATQYPESEFAHRYSAVAARNFALGDYMEMCPPSGGERCRTAYVNEIRNSLKKIHRALSKMKSVAGDARQFTRAYAEFGKELTRNGLVVQAALALAGAGVEASLRLEGTRISVYEKVLVTTERPYEYKLVSKPGELPVVAPPPWTDRQRGILVHPGAILASPVNSH